MQYIDLENYKSDELYTKIGANVARIRQAKGVSQLELAMAIGLKSGGLVSVAEIHHNKRHFNIQHLFLISKALDVSIMEFFKDIDNLKVDVPTSGEAPS